MAPIVNGTNTAEFLIGDSEKNTINGFAGDDTLRGGAGNDRLNGGDGIDTANYSKSRRGIIANLDRETVLTPIYGAFKKPKIMPLGDSITKGEHGEPTLGAYRIQLWKNFSADGLRVDFVGSGSNGPRSLGDKEHEGHGGWKINQITGLVDDGLLNTYKPDIVLLMIGTNDMGRSSPNKMYADLSNLIDKISEQSPNTRILVSSVAPQDPSIVGKAIANKTKEFNALIPDLVEDKIAQGKEVDFVNAGGNLSLEDLVSDGFHPTARGYNKIGNAWYDALVERDTLSDIENITGTPFNDSLFGNKDANVLEGGPGNDILRGGGGADTFVYKQVSKDGRDTIINFSFDDRFMISAAGFGGDLVAGTALSTTAFVNSPTPEPIGTNASFLYDTSTGRLSFDVDGTGSRSALTFATLAGASSLDATQFFIV